MALHLGSHQLITGWSDPWVNFLGIHTHGHCYQKNFLLNIVSNARWLLFCAYHNIYWVFAHPPQMRQDLLLLYKPAVHGHLWCRDINRILIVCESVECWLPARMFQSWRIPDSRPEVLFVWRVICAEYGFAKVNPVCKTEKKARERKASQSIK